MQILPSDAFRNDIGTANASRQQDLVDRDTFASLMQEASEAASPYVDTAKIATAAHIAAEDTASHATGINKSVSDRVRSNTEFSLDDIVALRNEMAQYGLSQDAAERLNALASQPGTKTLGRVIAALRGSGVAQELQNEDALQLRSFMGKLGMMQDATDTTLDNVANGNALQAWRAMYGKLQTLPADATLTVDASEIKTLAQGLRLSPQATDALTKSFGGADSLTLNPAQFKQLLVPLQQEMALRESQEAQINKALGKALDPVLARMNKREESARSANRLGSKEADHSEALIRNTVLHKSETASGPTTPAASATSAANTLHGLGAATPQGTDANGGNAAGHDRQQDRNQQDTSRGHGKDANAAAFLATHRDEQTTRKTSSADGAWDQLLQRVQLSGAHNPLAAQTAQPVQNMTVVQGGTPMGAQAAHVLSQVEQGLFANMRDGTQRLELQLTPVDLGSLNVALTVRNGEVSAIIRPDNTETASMLNEHLDKLRNALEQQGLKVDKLEVQTQTQQNGNSWQGTANHNAAQEQQERTQAMERLRRLGRIRQDASAVPELAREMQNTGSTARFAASGIDIIA